MKKFPKDFLFGVSTSSYQIEGGNFNSDWYYFEKQGKIKTNSKICCDHRNRFKEDLSLLKKLNLNAYRFSLEWARVEPKENQFDEKEIQYYKSIVKILRDNKIEPFLTLHHLTNPVWFYKKGGFEKKENLKYFLNYLRKIVKVFKKEVKFWIVFNEPNAFCFAGWTSGVNPPQKKDPILHLKVLRNILTCYQQSYKIIHQNIKRAQVGIAQDIIFFEPFRKKSNLDWLATFLLDFISNEIIIKNLYEGKTLFPLGVDKKKEKAKADFIGINYYTRFLVRFDPNEFCFAKKIVNPKVKIKTQTGWEVYPEGLTQVLLRFKKYKKPIYILENGIATLNEKEREKFILSHLEKILQAIRRKINVKGYFYWSLLDNLEWAEGFTPKFGIVKVDFKTQKREIKESGYFYARIAKRKAI